MLLWGVYLLPKPQKKMFQHLPTLLVNAWDNYIFGSLIRVTMTSPNVEIYICLKQILYCITIWQIAIKINHIGPKYLVNLAFWFMAVNNFWFFLILFTRQ